MTEAEFKRMLRAFEKELKAQAEEEVRRRYREEQGLIYVRTYTVAAHFRPAKKRQRRRWLKAV